MCYYHYSPVKSVGHLLPKLNAVFPTPIFWAVIPTKDGNFCVKNAYIDIRRRGVANYIQSYMYVIGDFPVWILKVNTVFFCNKKLT